MDNTTDSWFNSHTSTLLDSEITHSYSPQHTNVYIPWDPSPPQESRSSSADVQVHAQEPPPPCGEVPEFRLVERHATPAQGPSTPAEVPAVVDVQAHSPHEQVNAFRLADLQRHATPALCCEFLQS